MNDKGFLPCAVCGVACQQGRCWNSDCSIGHTRMKPENLRVFRIIRFFRDDRPSKTIRARLTESEAQAHCDRPDTMREGVYFDGYDYMKGKRPKGKI